MDRAGFGYKKSWTQLFPKRFEFMSQEDLNTLTTMSLNGARRRIILTGMISAPFKPRPERYTEHETDVLLDGYGRFPS